MRGWRAFLAFVVAAAAACTADQFGSPDASTDGGGVPDGAGA